MSTPTNRNLLFSYGGTAIVFKATNRNYTIIFITYNESSVIPTFPTCSAVFTGIRLPPYLSKLVNMVPWQKAINIGFTHFCDCRQSGKIVVAFAIVVSIKPCRFLYCHYSIFRCFFNCHTAFSHLFNQHTIAFGIYATSRHTFYIFYSW